MMEMRQNEERRWPGASCNQLQPWHCSGRDGGLEAVRLNQTARGRGVGGSSPPGQIKLLQTAMFPDSPAIWPSLCVCLCVCVCVSVCAHARACTHGCVWVCVEGRAQPPV